MSTYEQQYLKFQSNSAYVISNMKHYSPDAKYAAINIQGICSNLMNMTLATEKVISFADFLHAGVVTVTIDPKDKDSFLKGQKHEGFEVYFVMNGTLNVEIEDTFYRLKQYDAIIMNQNCKSMIQGGENLMLITITMTRDYLQKNNLMKAIKVLSYKSRYEDDVKDAEYVLLHAKDIPKGSAETPDAGVNAVGCKEDIEKLLHQFHTEMTKKIIGYEQIVPGLLMRLFYSITNENLYEIEKVKEQALAGEDLAENIKMYLDENKRRVTMEELTGIFHYNRNFLSKVFLENMNLSIKTYNNQVCMKEAKKLLEETDLPVALIAERLGFMSRSQFYKVYEEQFGCTPKSTRS